MDINAPFFNLINYNNSEIELLNEADSITYINNLLNYPDVLNDSLHPLINYEKLIFIEIKFQQNQKIQDLLRQLKHRISENYIYKQKYLLRVFPKDQKYNHI